MLSVYSMYRGLLNFIDTVANGSEDTCKYMTLCEAAHIAAARGQHGAVISLVGGYRAGTWIEASGYGTRAEVMSAVAHGVSSLSGTCNATYPCDERSPGYKSPITNTNNKYSVTSSMSTEDKNIFKKVLHEIKVKTL